MHFNKPALSITDQLNLLKSRGLTISDDTIVENWFRSVSYYRLSGYWLPFELPPPPERTRSKQFIAGTTFDDIIDLYIFDRELRLITMEAIERIEIALRARWTYHVVHALGPHAHLNPDNFDLNYWKSKYWSMVASLSKSTGQSDEVFIKHYLKKYKTPNSPPLWAVTELMSFGELSIWVSMTKDKKITHRVARDIGFPNVKTLEGALQNIALVRNKCAHHSRLWNRKFTKRTPAIKSLSNVLVYAGPVHQRQADNKLYNTLVLLVHLLRRQAPTTTYPARLKALINKRHLGDQGSMGFPQNWDQQKFWN